MQDKITGQFKMTCVRVYSLLVIIRFRQGILTWITTVDLLVQTSSAQLLFILKLRVPFFAKQSILMRRSSV
jgi:hypothetical protein